MNSGLRSLHLNDDKCQDEAFWISVKIAEVRVEGLGGYSLVALTIDLVLEVFLYTWYLSMRIETFGRYEDIRMSKFQTHLHMSPRKRIDSWVTSQYPASRLISLGFSCNYANSIMTLYLQIYESKNIPNLLLAALRSDRADPAHGGQLFVDTSSESRVDS